MIKMNYSDWRYEYERCYDLFEKTGIHYYRTAIDILDLMYPDYFDKWLDDCIEFKNLEGVEDEIEFKNLEGVEDEID